MSSISQLSGLGPHRGSWFLGQQRSSASLSLWLLQSGGQDESIPESRLQGPRARSHSAQRLHLLRRTLIPSPHLHSRHTGRQGGHFQIHIQSQ